MCGVLMSKNGNGNGDPWKFLKATGIPFATWVTIIVFGTLFYSDNQAYQKDTNERFDRNETLEAERFDKQEKRFDEFSKQRDTQVSEQRQLLLEVRDIAGSLKAAVSSIQDIRSEQKEMRTEQMKINDTVRDLKAVR